MRIVLTGAHGQLGRDLKQVLEAEGNWAKVVPLTHQEIEITDPVGSRRTLEGSAPDLVINTAAYHRVDLCEDEAEMALKVNAYGARNLARICCQLDIPLVHYSTDYVFDGEKRIPYAEEDPPNPLSAYGISKLAGELFIRYIAPKHFIIRTCGLYGVGGATSQTGNFVETMLRLAAEGRSIRVVDDQIATPTYVADLARKTAELIRTQHYGLYHITNNGQCSWYELAGAIFRIAGVEADLHPTTSREFGAKARRPAYSVLKNCHLERLGMDDLRDWQDALAEYLKERIR